MPTWHGTLDWEVGQLVTAADLNAQVRDNQGYLFQRPLGRQSSPMTANYASTSTSFVDIHAADFAVTLDIKSGRARVHFHGSVFLQGSVAGSQRAFFDISVDGSRLAGGDGICFVETVNNGPQYVSFTRLVEGIAPGAHTFRVQWRGYASAGSPTLTLYAGGGTSLANVHPQFVAEEC